VASRLRDRQRPELILGREALLGRGNAGSALAEGSGMIEGNA
jgi:hypothetical protein